MLIDLHKDAQRQGPGGEAETKRAIDLAHLDRSRPLRIADIGCGTGASTIILARELEAQVTAVDLFPEFLDELQSRTRLRRVADRIHTVVSSMDSLPFPEAEFDAIWSEGAVYNMGFEKGVSSWRRFLKPGGILAVSEITWLTSSRPPEIQAHWEREYPEIDTASRKMGILERQGFSPVGYFVLPDNCWIGNYYRPMQESFAGFLARNGNSEQAQAVVDAEKTEIALYEKYRAWYGYGFYIAKKSEVP